MRNTVCEPVVKENMRYLIYNLLLYICAPLVFLYLLFSKRNRGMIRRFQAELHRCPESPIWFHACSVGEVGVAALLIKELSAQLPDNAFLLSVSTRTGMKQAQASKTNAVLTYLPFDLPHLIRRFVNHYRPSVLILIETELWPNLVKTMYLFGKPVVVVNARLSDKHFPRYKFLNKVASQVFSMLSCVCTQEETYNARFQALGVPAERICSTGNLKYDQEPLFLSPEQRCAVKKEIGIGERAQVVIFGSTHPGEEKLAARCWEELSAQYEDLFLIIAPRHLNRMKSAVEPFAGTDFRRRSLLGEPQGSRENSRILFLDTMGELAKLYQIADIAVIGGSFFPGVEGHNPLEPAAVGVPVLFGSHMESFKDAVRLLLEAGGAVQVTSPEALSGALERLLEDKPLRAKMGNNGLDAVKKNQGATGRTLAEVLSWLEKR